MNEDYKDIASLSLPGLDIQDGIQRLGGDAELYVEMISEYVQEMGSFSADFLALVEKQDFEAARRSAHSLKGASGNVAAVTLYDAAKALEMACLTKDKSQILPLVQPVVAALEEVTGSVSELENVFRGAANPSDAPPSTDAPPP